MPTDTPDIAANTVRALAAVLDRSRTQVANYRARTDWPVSADPPWTEDDVEKIREWQKSLRPTPAQFREQRKGELDAKEATARLKQRKMQMELDILEGKYVSREEVENGRLQRIQAVKTAMLSHARRMAPVVAQMEDPIEVEKVLHEDILEICDVFSGKGTDAGVDSV